MYDLILRDATIVSPAGRLVADVAVKNGTIAYVGPRPPRRRCKREISAIGRFLVPGLIDVATLPSATADADSWAHETLAALSGGITTSVVLPHGAEPVVDRATAEARRARLLEASHTHFALWGGATADNADTLAALVDDGTLIGVLADLDGEGHPAVTLAELAQHVRGEHLLALQLDRVAERGPEAIDALLDATAGHRGHVHLAQISSSHEVGALDPLKGKRPASSSVSLHSLFLSDEAPASTDHPFHTVPRVRPEHDRRTLWSAIRRGRIDCLASGHVGGAAELGVPAAELLLPLALSAVRQGKLGLEGLATMLAAGPAQVLGLETKGRIEKGADADLVLFTEGEVSKVRAARLLGGANWSPFEGREMSPKPDLVVLGGQIVSEAGELTVDAPLGRPVSRTAAGAA